MKFLVSIVAIILVAGCATADRLNNIQLGMSEQEVVDVLGAPKSTSAQRNTEYMNYLFFDESNPGGNWVPHFVRLVDGKVESFGATGDFDSTKTDTIRIETDENVSIDGKSDLYTELRKLKSLHDEGVLTDQEYDSLKQAAINKY